MLFFLYDFIFHKSEIRTVLLEVGIVLGLLKKTLLKTVVWDVLSLRGDDPCLHEQKKAYYLWDIHNWLTFVRARQIVPKTLFR